MSSGIEIGSIKMKIYNWVFTLTFSRSLNKMARIIGVTPMTDSTRLRARAGTRHISHRKHAPFPLFSSSWHPLFRLSLSYLFLFSCCIFLIFSFLFFLFLLLILRSSLFIHLFFISFVEFFSTRIFNFSSLSPPFVYHSHSRSLSAKWFFNRFLRSFIEW